MPIAVNHQPGHWAKHRGRVKDIREGLGDSCRSNIPRDVASKLGGRQPQILELGGDIAAGVIAEDYESALAFGPKHSWIQLSAPLVTLTETSMLLKDEEGPMYVPHNGRTCLESQATATRIRFRLPMMLLVGSKSTHPAPGR